MTSPPSRIISLTPTGFDILSELEVSPVKILSGSYFVPNFWAIAQAKPELIIGCVFPHRFWLRRLQQIAPVFLVTGNGDFETACQQLQDIAQLLGREQQALEVITTLKSQIKHYQTQLAFLGCVIS
ncbi:MAG: ABC transporter substrate-binding protein [Synechococcaceae cyanobacterium SM2_3_2]|nr:ABC transporter substrate-binding protein [Synechococcaceae cyanobacterium SM2_3_2]